MGSSDQGGNSRRKLISYLRSRLSSGDEAEDLVQEAYARLQAYARKGEVVDGERFVWRTALNLAVSLRRRAVVRDRVHGDQAVIELLSPVTHAPDEVLELRERLALVEKAIAELPERCRAVFVACRIEGMSYTAAARRFGISVSAVEKHMARAIAHMTLKVEGFGRRAKPSD